MIYSPEEPFKYTRGVKCDHGHGFDYTGAAWNLCWLTFPQVDLYLDSSLKLGEILPKFEPRWVIYLDMEVRDKGSLILAAAGLPIEDFKVAFTGRVKEDNYLYSEFGKKWSDIVERRVEERIGVSGVTPSNIVSLSAWRLSRGVG